MADVIGAAGDDFSPSNYFNIGAVLAMWVVTPAFGAAAYVPSITLGELCECSVLQAVVLGQRAQHSCDHYP